MPRILKFNEQFLPMILDGTKKTTFRICNNHRKPYWQVGAVQLAYGQRSNPQVFAKATIRRISWYLIGNTEDANIRITDIGPDILADLQSGEITYGEFVQGHQYACWVYGIDGDKQGMKICDDIAREDGFADFIDMIDCLNRIYKIGIASLFQCLHIDNVKPV
ncbi:MAG: hypothetical protein AAF404_01320 [Pseudomonadota bacterium]